MKMMKNDSKMTDLLPIIRELAGASAELVHTQPGHGAPPPLAPTEDIAEFEAVLTQFRVELVPRSMVDQMLVYQLAATAWRLRRIPFYETRATSQLGTRASAVRVLEALSRHEARLLRSFYDMLRELGVQAVHPSGARAHATGPRTALSRPPIRRLLPA